MNDLMIRLREWVGEHDASGLCRASMRNSPLRRRTSQVKANGLWCDSVRRPSFALRPGSIEITIGALLGVDTDNGSEFLTKTMLAWVRRRLRRSHWLASITCSYRVASA